MTTVRSATAPSTKSAFLTAYSSHWNNRTIIALAGLASASLLYLAYRFFKSSFHPEQFCRERHYSKRHSHHSSLDERTSLPFYAPFAQGIIQIDRSLFSIAKEDSNVIISCSYNSICFFAQPVPATAPFWNIFLENMPYNESINLKISIDGIDRSLKLKVSNPLAIYQIKENILDPQNVSITSHPCHKLNTPLVQAMGTLDMSQRVKLVILGREGICYRPTTTQEAYHEICNRTMRIATLILELLDIKSHQFIRLPIVVQPGETLKFEENFLVQSWKYVYYHSTSSPLDEEPQLKLHYIESTFHTPPNQKFFDKIKSFFKD